MNIADAPASVQKVMGTRVFAKPDTPSMGVGDRPTIIQGSLGLTYHAWLIGQAVSGLVAINSLSPDYVAQRAIDIADAICTKVAKSLEPKQEAEATH